tara:strand:+ start:349 stop:501 length:153 start_codon:yes stop_codon:yes gene_type:complete
MEKRSLINKCVQIPFEASIKKLPTIKGMQQTGVNQFIQADGAHFHFCFYL